MKVLNQVGSFAAVVMAVCSGLTACGGDFEAMSSEELDELDDVATARQGVSGTVTPGATQVLVCEDKDFKGFCDLITVGNHAQSVGIGNDKLSSFKVGSAVRVTFCSNPTYGGECQTYSSNRQITSMTSPPDNSASSSRVVSTSVPDCRINNPGEGWVFLYRDSNYGGDCVAHVPGSWKTAAELGLANDSMSSFKLGPSVRSRVTFYRDPNYQNSVGSFASNGALILAPTVSPNDVVSSVRLSFCETGC